MLTLVIPTKDRSLFLMRLLSYYNQQRLTYRLVIADSSDSDSRPQAQRIIDSFKANLNIEHRVYESDIEFARKLDDALKLVDTPYVVLNADDDFFIPRALDRAVEFLRTHPDYNLAHGDTASFVSRSDGVHDLICRVSRYNQPTIGHESAVKRFNEHLANYSATLYSVQRTDPMRENWRKTAELRLDCFFHELLPSCLSLIQGKAKKLNGLYIVRQSHPENKYSGPDLFDWATSQNWGNQYEKFRNCIAEELVRQEDIAIDEARALVKQAFWLYLSKGFSTQWQDNYPNDHRSYWNSRIGNSFRNTLRRVPLLRQAWRRLRNTTSRQLEPEISLSALLSKSSPYYQDFQPIYRAVTEAPKELQKEVGTPP